MVPISLLSISRFACPTIEPPGVYSSLTMFLGPAWSVRPERSTIKIIHQWMQFELHRARLTDAWRHYPLVVVGIDAHRVALEVERVLAVLNMLQLILVQVRPSPDACINYVWESLAASDLQTPIQCSLDRDAFAGMRPVRGDGSDQRVQLVSLLLQFLHQ